jgi:hypothetical protein
MQSVQQLYCCKKESPICPWYLEGIKRVPDKFVCSQIWLNYFLDDRHYGYITKSLKETLLWGIMGKKFKKSHGQFLCQVKAFPFIHSGFYPTLQNKGLDNYLRRWEISVMYPSSRDFLPTHFRLSYLPTSPFHTYPFPHFIPTHFPISYLPISPFHTYPFPPFIPTYLLPAFHTYPLLTFHTYPLPHFIPT